MRTCSKCGGPLYSNSKTGVCLRNPECRKAVNREKSRQYQRALPPEVTKANNLLHSHGITAAEKQAMLDAQGGGCYLCGDPLAYDEAVIDHDHRCCSDVTKSGRPRTTSCDYCRRGLACGRCNILIGMARDDAERLIRIARNLAAAMLARRTRMAGESQQLTLGLAEAS